MQSLIRDGEDYLKRVGGRVKILNEQNKLNLNDD